jgi:hypothetical protein
MNKEGCIHRSDVLISAKWRWAALQVMAAPDDVTGNCSSVMRRASTDVDTGRHLRHTVWMERVARVMASRAAAQKCTAAAPTKTDGASGSGKAGGEGMEVSAV